MLQKTTKACCWTPGIHTDDFRVDHMKYLSRLYKAVEHDKLRSFHTVFHEILMHSYSITYNQRSIENSKMLNGHAHLHETSLCRRKLALSEYVIKIRYTSLQTWWTRQAFNLFTLCPVKSWCTAAVISVDSICASCIVFAGMAVTSNFLGV